MLPTLQESQSHGLTPLVDSTADDVFPDVTPESDVDSTSDWEAFENQTSKLHVAIESAAARAVPSVKHHYVYLIVNVHNFLPFNIMQSSQVNLKPMRA